MIQEKLLQATFKGVTFYWRRLDTTLGKETVTHKYPGTGKWAHEDMGALPKTFTIEAVISGGGEQYMLNKENLERALTSPGPGYLVHPTYGRVLVTAKPARCIEDDKTLGAARYSLTFERTEETLRPVGSSSNDRQVELKRDASSNAVVSACSKDFTAPESPSIFDIVTGSVMSVTNQIEEVVGNVSSTRDNAFTVFNSINAFKNSVSRLVTQPLALFNDMKAIFDNIMSIDDNFVDQFERVTGLFGSSPDIGPSDKFTENKTIKPISYETKQAERNRVLTNEASNMLALINAYSSLSKIDFKSTQQLDSFLNTIEQQFAIMQESTLMQSEVREPLLELRMYAHNIVEKKRLLIKDIISVDINGELPLSVAMFMYSGSIDDEDYVLGINPEQDPVFAKGEVNLLQ